MLLAQSCKHVLKTNVMGRHDNNMGFETKVLNVIHDEVPQAYFYNGTLICENIGEDTAANVYYDLQAVVTCDVLMSRTPSETLYDFALFK